MLTEPNGARRQPENKLPLIDYRRQTDRVTGSVNPNLDLDIHTKILVSFENKRISSEKNKFQVQKMTNVSIVGDLYRCFITLGSFPVITLLQLEHVVLFVGGITLNRVES